MVSKNKKNIISITGVPGTGKTTVAKELGNKLGMKVLSDKDIKIKKKYDSKRKCSILEISDVKKFIKEKLGKKEFSNGFIFDSHIAHKIDSKHIKHCFVLRCNPLTLRKRLEKRKYNKEKIKENIEAEIIDLILLEALDKKHLVHEIDTSNKKCEDVVKEIKRVLEGKKKSKYGSTNFLKYVPGYIC